MRIAAHIQKYRKDFSNLNLPARIRRIVMYAADAHGVTLGQILGPSRERTVVRARRQASQALRATGLSFPVIGRYLRKHHASIKYACDQPVVSGEFAQVRDDEPIRIPDLSGEWAI